MSSSWVAALRGWPRGKFGRQALVMETMRKVLRIILGVAIVGLVLHTASLATQDCRIAPYAYDNCMWVRLRTLLGLPASRFLRMAVLECVGIVLALVLYLTFRYVFPFRRATLVTPDSSSPPASEPPRN
jgi:TctA family transporter